MHTQRKQHNTQRTRYSSNVYKLSARKYISRAAVAKIALYYEAAHTAKHVATVAVAQSNVTCIATRNKLQAV